MITVADLVRLLQDKDQDEKVEAVIATTDGRIIVAYARSQAPNMIKMLNLLEK